jgi:hypothetical protein
MVFVTVAYLRVFGSVFTTRREPPPPPYHPPRPYCNFNLFQSHVDSRPDGYLSGAGHWTRLADGTPDRYYPTLCSFPYGQTLPVNRLQQCLETERLRYIVLTGDSNSMRYFRALHDMMSALPNARCRTEKADNYTGFSVNPKYFDDESLNSSHVIVHDRDCRGCKNERVRCQFVGADNVTASHVVVENVVLEFTIDTEVTSRKLIHDCVEVTGSDVTNIGNRDKIKAWSDDNVPSSQLIEYC